MFLYNFYIFWSKNELNDPNQSSMKYLICIESSHGQQYEKSLNSNMCEEVVKIPFRCVKNHCLTKRTLKQTLSCHVSLHLDSLVPSKNLSTSPIVKWGCYSPQQSTLHIISFALNMFGERPTLNPFSVAKSGCSNQVSHCHH